MNAAELTDLLRRHYLPESRPPAGLFATEIGSPDGRRRADALWMPLVASAGEELIGHEIKVSRSDVIVELADPTKAEPWMQFCGRWWLVVADPALVDGLEVPAAWGIMSPPSGRRTRSMTVVRPAPALNPKEPARAMQRLLAWSYFRDRERVASLEHQHAADQRQIDRQNNTIEQLRDSKDAVANPLARRAIALLNTVDRLAAGRDVWRDLDDLDDLIAQAVVDRLVVERGTESLARGLDRVLQVLDDPFNYARKHITAARKLVTAKEST